MSSELQPVARLGDRLSSGGEITGASALLTSDGIPIARVGDPVYCPITGHGQNAIASGSPYVFEAGIPLAHVGSTCECGCTIVTGSSVVKVGI